MRLLYLFALSFILQIPNTGAQIITTYAGDGFGGATGDGGLAINAGLNQLNGLCFDKEGNLLICQYLFVRKVDKLTGIISTVAGSDTAQNPLDYVPATTTILEMPYAICVDKIGNYYVSDFWGGDIAIRKVDVGTGIITTFAGTKVAGNYGDGGPANLATFDFITGMCMDTTRGYMYVSDENNHRVRKINMLTDTVTAFAGTGTLGYSGDGGPAVNATFGRVMGICNDTAGNVYIGDWENARIRRVDYATGTVTTIAGTGISGFSGDGALATSAMINQPTYICFDKHGDLYFSDAANFRIRKIDMQTGVINTIAGNGTHGYSGDGGQAINAEFSWPEGICIDNDDNLYVSDFSNNRVRKIAMGTAGISGVRIDGGMSVYPNPARNRLTLVGTERYGSFDLKIVNAIGETIMKQSCIGKDKIVLDIDGLASGFYFVLLNDNKNGQQIIKQFLKD